MTDQPHSGFRRVAYVEPCEIDDGNGCREGTIWNLSVLGLYVILDPPIPRAGETVFITFRLPGDPVPLRAQTLVRWDNPTSRLRGTGKIKLSLPPGCGLQFVALTAEDRARIQARVRATYPDTHE